MKRIILPLCALLLLLLPACGEEEVVDPSEVPSEIVSELPTPDPEPTPTPIVNPLTGEPTDDESLSSRRPVAIMLNNLKAAMPQQGNSQADIIYEVLAEGGITRMVGVYQDPTGLWVPSALPGSTTGSCPRGMTRCSSTPGAVLNSIPQKKPWA
mgnify:CR=1 FL=1